MEQKRKKVMKTPVFTLVVYNWNSNEAMEGSSSLVLCNKTALKYLILQSDFFHRLTLLCWFTYLSDLWMYKCHDAFKYHNICTVYSFLQQTQQTYRMLLLNM